MRVLVTGGAGYIGSHTVIQLAAAGHQPILVDNFRNAKAAVVPAVERLAGLNFELHRFDLADQGQTDALFAERSIDAVIHFAGLKAVAESVRQPLDYYQNNLDSTLSLVRAMQRHGVRQLVFSSSATVYGPDAVVPIREESPTSATNPYGWSKVMIEQVLRDVAAADDSWRIALLRYFNPCGAHESGTIGEDPAGIPNNLVPCIAQVAAGQRDRLQIFGGDYPTLDGTAVRDYVHVEDLALGHLAALCRLDQTQEGVGVWNLGTGRGTSVLEMLHIFEGACGRQLPYEVVERRAGDVAVSFADVTRAWVELGWRATRDLDQICADIGAGGAGAKVGNSDPRTAPQHGQVNGFGVMGQSDCIRTALIETAAFKGLNRSRRHSRKPIAPMLAISSRPSGLRSSADLWERLARSIPHQPHWRSETSGESKVMGG